MTDFILALLLLAIVGFAIYMIVKNNKSGRKCIGCPYADSCAGKCGNNTK